MKILTDAARPAYNYFLSTPALPKQRMAGYLLLCSLLLFSFVADAQTDTFGLAKKYKSEGKLKEAARLLQAYHNAHPNDLNSTWVYAQTTYWLQDFKKATSLYEQAIKDHPNNYYLKLDYAHVLIATGNAKKAKPILATYRAFDSTSVGFIASLSGMFWEDAHRTPNEALYRGYAPTAADTLNKVKQLRDKGQYHNAYHLLKQYYPAHKNDFNTNWLYAQIVYLAKHFKESKTLYRNAVTAHPDNYYLKLDYANTLTNIADYREALPLLDTYSKYDPTNIKLELSLAKVYLAQGNFDLAEKNITAVLNQDNHNADALSLLDELHLAKASWLKIQGNYTIDNQPLQTITPAVEAGVYLHPEATLKMNVQTPLFISNSSLKNAEILQVGDVSQFRKTGTQLAFDAGVVKQPFKNKISWTANLELKQTLFKHLVLQAQAERKSYYNTISSLDTVVMVNRVSAYAGWNDPNSWNGRLAFEYNGFADKNYLLSGAAWVFTPPLKASVFEFRIGYAYSFSTAKSNKFVPEKTVAQILNPYDPAATITGIYDPYFTPYDMSIHAGLASIVAHPVKMLDIGFNANVGFYASSMTPYFYLNKDARDALIVSKDYANEKFYPMEFSAYALLRITKKISLKADYTYRKTYFYTSNSAGLGLKINFGHEQKGK